MEPGKGGPAKADGRGGKAGEGGQVHVAPGPRMKRPMELTGPKLQPGAQPQSAQPRGAHPDQGPHEGEKSMLIQSPSGMTAIEICLKHLHPVGSKGYYHYFL